MRFFGPDPDTGKVGGMLARVKENRPHECLSLEQHADLQDSAQKPIDPRGFENYALADKDGGMVVPIELTNLSDDYAAMFDEMWPKSLEKLKEIAKREL